MSSGGEGLTALIVGGDTAVRRLFKDKGFAITLDPDEEYDVAVFTGGEDICPMYYGQKPHKSIKFNLTRDMYEMNVLRRMPYMLPKIGICRGGQLLNIFNGGSMYQDVNGHSAGEHEIILLDQVGKPTAKTNSFHHQMMIPASDNCEVLAIAHTSTQRLLVDYMGKELKFSQPKESKVKHPEPEILMYWYSTSLCFQGHPEYGSKPTTELFWDYADSYIINNIHTAKAKENGKK